MNKKSFFVLLLSLLIYSTGSSVLSQENGTLPDVLIQAEEKRPLDREKPPLLLKIKEDSSLESLLKTEKELKLKIPYEIADSTQFVTGISNSPYAIVSRSSRIILPSRGEIVRTFYPLKTLMKVYQKRISKKQQSETKWKFVVADSQGRVFREFRGEGLPPETLIFDGRNSEGEWIHVGQTYTGVLTYQASMGRLHTMVSQPFALIGLGVRSREGLIITLSVQELLERKEGGYRVSKDGKKILHEAAHIIQRYYPGLSLEIGAFLKQSDRSTVLSMGESCRDELTRRLLLSADEVPVRANPGTPDIEERIELVVGGLK